MTSESNRILSIAAWILAACLVVLAVYLGWNTWSARAQVHATTVEDQAILLPTIIPPQGDGSPVSLPIFAELPVGQEPAVSRQASLHTTIPNRPRLDITSYLVDIGDSVFEIARRFNITPETLLWANYDLLNDNPDLISIGMELKIPPTNGVYYQWQENDTIESIAARFEANPEDVLSWSGNGLDLTNPVMESGSWIMVPGGHREFRQWIIPVIPRGRAGVSRELYGAGACQGSYDGAYGTGGFVWPAGNHVLSGNDYWSGHLGIDVAAGEGAQVYTADSGVVVFAGWANGGYGNMVMIDHGNGYQTLYAHMNQVSVSCGQSVNQGQTIGYSGSTGNSTGAHLHFEVRYQGGFVSPWFVLPAP
jgi:murein DD-endopeptidase MepM/ murein hydrolase activator NlpD